MRREATKLLATPRCGRNKCVVGAGKGENDRLYTLQITPYAYRIQEAKPRGNPAQTPRTMQENEGAIVRPGLTHDTLRQTTPLTVTH